MGSKMAPSFAEATTVEQTSSHTYTAQLQEEWCIGTVPHGGYIASVIQRAVKLHFATTHAQTDQPDCMSMHLEYVRRTSVGPALITIADTKIGRAISTVHITVSQNLDSSRSADPRVEIVGYITQTNLAKENGLSFDTKWELSPRPIIADVAEFATDTDPNWKRLDNNAFAKFRKAGARVKWMEPRKRIPGFRGFEDRWTALSTVHPSAPSIPSHSTDEPTAAPTVAGAGVVNIENPQPERITNDTLGYLADIFPQLVQVAADAQDPGPRKASRLHWYPTLSMNVEIKKALPPGGVEWVFQRVRAKQMKNGRYDLEVVMLDQGGELVMLSHHIVQVLDASRNVSERGTGKPSKKEVKL